MLIVRLLPRRFSLGWDWEISLVLLSIISDVDAVFSDVGAVFITPVSSDSH